MRQSVKALNYHKALQISIFTTKYTHNKTKLLKEPLNTWWALYGHVKLCAFGF